MKLGRLRELKAGSGGGSGLIKAGESACRDSGGGSLAEISKQDESVRSKEETS